MGTFDDANVDKDLLSQIFADEGDDAETDALLDEMLKDVEKEAAKKEEQAEAVQEELPLEEIAAEAEPEEAQAEEVPVEEEMPAEEIAEEPAAEAASQALNFETNTENDSVRRCATLKYDPDLIIFGNASHIKQCPLCQFFHEQIFFQMRPHSLIARTDLIFAAKAPLLMVHINLRKFQIIRKFPIHIRQKLSVLLTCYVLIHPVHHT